MNEESRDGVKQKMSREKQDHLEIHFFENWDYVNLVAIESKSVVRWPKYDVKRCIYDLFQCKHNLDKRIQALLLFNHKTDSLDQQR